MLYYLHSLIRNMTLTNILTNSSSFYNLNKQNLLELVKKAYVIILDS